MIVDRCVGSGGDSIMGAGRKSSNHRNHSVCLVGLSLHPGRGLDLGFCGMELESAACHRNFLGTSGLKILKFYPDLSAVIHADLQRIQTTRRGTGRIVDLTSQIECAIMARTEIAAAFGKEIDEATGVRANDIKRLHLA